MSFDVTADVWKDSRNLDAQSLLVLLCLADHADDKGVCWPSLATIAQRTHLSLATVKRSLAELEVHRRIERTRRFIPGTQVHASTQYLIKIQPGVGSDRARGLAHTEPGVGSHRADGRLTQSQGSAHTEPTKNQSYNQSRNQSENQNPPTPLKGELTLEGGSGPDPVEVIFDHWKAIHGHPTAKLDEKRGKVIRRALRAYSAEQLRQAIQGYKHSPFHMGVNDTATVYDAIDLLLRDARHIDQGLHLFHVKRSTAGQSAPEVQDWEAYDAILLRHGYDPSAQRGERGFWAGTYEEAMKLGEKTA